jgi:CheY-like chemotaxis protein/two-component sensor histidine kinase
VHAIELARLHGVPDDNLKELFDIVDRQTGVLNDIISNLLDAARAIGGKIELQMELVDFGTIVKHAIESTAPLIKSSGHTLEVHDSPRPIRTLLDPGRVEQIIVNLLNNAAKYTKQGGHITVSTSEDGDNLVLRIKDTGIGIAPEVLQNIFSPFYQGKQSLNDFKGGLGVGLMLASTLARLHGGTLTAQSEGVGKGSEFTLRLPIRESTSSVHAQKDIDIKDIRLEKKRVLIVDDNRELAGVFGKLLTQLNQEVYVTYSSTEAQQVADTHMPDIVFIDVAMPYMSGYELVKLLRNNEKLNKTKFVALSGFGREYNRKSLEAGFDEHVVKPVKPADLQRLLSSAGK